MRKIFLDTFYLQVLTSTEDDTHNDHNDYS